MRFAWVPIAMLAAAPLEAAGPSWRDALTFYASFDRSVDADYARGDARIWTATSYREREDAAPGLRHPDVSVAAGKGRPGGALEFRRKNTRAVFYQAAGNMNYSSGRLTGTVSFWLSLDPETDLEPGFCDPIQITDEAYNDSAIWVDFTKDDKPRHFRLGVFGDRSSWNPEKTPDDKNPVFLNRLVVVSKTPFGKGRWTHVAITFDGLGSSEGGRAALYLDGKLQGKRDGIRDVFEWNPARAAIRVGVNYVGLFDELSVFDRALTDQEIAALYAVRGRLR